MKGAITIAHCDFDYGTFGFVSLRRHCMSMCPFRDIAARKQAEAQAKASGRGGKGLEPYVFYTHVDIPLLVFK